MTTKLETRNSKLETGGILAVIMARGGSVGLPNKSLRPLLGRPVIAYTFDHVRESRLITRSVVSSDDADILKLAGESGFEILKRPGELATATAATDPVLRHAVRSLYPKYFTAENAEGAEKNKKGIHSASSAPIASSAVKSEFPFAVLMLYGNIPIRRNRMIDRCVELLLETNADSVQTIAPVGKFHPYWMFDLAPDQRIQKHIPNNIFRRQDLPPLYAPTGAVYAMRTGILMSSEGNADPHAFLGADRRGLITNPEDSVDIDSEKDLYLAEAILKS